MMRKLGFILLCVLLLPAVGCQPAPQADLAEQDEEQVPDASDATDAPVADDSRDVRPGFVQSEFVLAQHVRHASELCGIRVNGTKLSATPLPLDGNAEVEISGWMADESTMSWPERPMLLVERGGSKPRLWQFDLPAQGTSRGDVERNFQLPSMRMTGFLVSVVPSSSIPDGNYRLHAAYYRDGGLVICRRGGAFSVRRQP